MSLSYLIAALRPTSENRRPPAQDRRRDKFQPHAGGPMTQPNDNRKESSPKLNPGPPPTRQESTSAQWRDHEHVTEQAQLQAQKLVDEAGTPELAKQAVDAAQQRQALPPKNKDELARRLGYVSFLALFEASMPVATGKGKHWCVTPLEKGRWVAWNDEDLEPREEFDSLEEALAGVRRRAARQGPKREEENLSSQTG
jgi:hypothetical protein